jgi:hypothetical protein
MILAIVTSLRHFLGWTVSVFSSRQDLILENLALRQQVLALLAPDISKVNADRLLNLRLSAGTLRNEDDALVFSWEQSLRSLKDLLIPFPSTNLRGWRLPGLGAKLQHREHDTNPQLGRRDLRSLESEP